MISCALIGYGYWGQVLSRRLSEVNGFSLKYICDLNYESLLQQDPKIEFKSRPAFIQDAQKVFRDPLIEVVFIATLRTATINSRIRHCLMENMFTENLNYKFKEYSSLVDLAEQKNRLLYVDFIVLFEPWLKTLSLGFDRS